MSDQEIINACESSLTMSEACSKVGIHFNTFKRHAVRLGVYKPNQGGKGMKKNILGNKYPIKDILEGKYPYYQTNKLRHRLIKEGIKEKKCEICGITKWNGMELSFELNHIDGNKNNHLLDNLQIICPNCHSQTSTYRGKNVKR